MSCCRFGALGGALLLLACGKIDPSAVGLGSSKQTGDEAAADAGSAGATTTSPPCASARAAYHVDFEDGLIGGGVLDVGGGANALTIDKISPISGMASLRIDPSFGFVTREMNENGGRCAVRLEFTIRASVEFLSDSRTLAMIDAGSRRFIVWVNQNTLALMQEQEGGKYGGGVSSSLLGGELRADTPTTIAIELDAPSVTVMSSVHSPSAIDDVPLHAVDVFLIPDTPPASIRAVHIGSVPGVKSQPSGTYWIDDIKIE